MTGLGHRNSHRHSVKQAHASDGGENADGRAREPVRFLAAVDGDLQTTKAERDQEEPGVIRSGGCLELCFAMRDQRGWFTNQRLHQDQRKEAQRGY